MPHVDGAGQAYPLNHLHPFRIMMQVGRQEVLLSVAFAMHCFSRGSVEDDDPADFYTDDREQRTFCRERYALSRLLPSIVHDLPIKPCLFARDDNFVAIETVSPYGQVLKYGVFFNLKRWKDVDIDPTDAADLKADVLLTIQSAYCLDPNKTLPGRGKIKFVRLVELTLQGVKPKPPRR